jgi:lipoprotein NlpD
LLFVSSCSSHHQPAPVVSLSTKVATPQNLTEITTDTYKVETGDTLFAIAFYSGNDYRDLAKLNKLAAPYTINVGQTLVLNPAPLPEPSRQQTRPIKEAVSKTNRKTPKAKQPAKSEPQQVAVSTRRIKKQQTYAKRPTAIVANKNLGWIWPADGNRTIATVGNDGNTRGLDIKGRIGSKIVAASGGKVVYAGNALKGYGNLVIIKHNDEYLSAYAHNKSILVVEQTYVKQGQQIATMGNSGASDTMLHFEIRKKGKSVDPFQYLPAH